MGKIIAFYCEKVNAFVFQKSGTKCVLKFNFNESNKKNSKSRFKFFKKLYKKHF